MFGSTARSRLSAVPLTCRGQTRAGQESKFHDAWRPDAVRPPGLGCQSGVARRLPAATRHVRLDAGTADYQAERGAGDVQGRADGNGVFRVAVADGRSMQWALGSLISIGYV